MTPCSSHNCLGLRFLFLFQFVGVPRVSDPLVIYASLFSCIMLFRRSFPFRSVSCIMFSCLGLNPPFVVDCVSFCTFAVTYIVSESHNGYTLQLSYPVCTREPFFFSSCRLRGSNYKPRYPGFRVSVTCVGRNKLVGRAYVCMSVSSRRPILSFFFPE